MRKGRKGDVWGAGEGGEGCSWAGGRKGNQLVRAERDAGGAGGGECGGGGVMRHEIVLEEEKVDRFRP